jgi:serine phosphatase RsbU (regulator of sigma subunit)
MRTSSLAPTQSLFHWIWRAFFRTALTPLLLVEVVLVLAYIASNNLVRDENLAAIRTVAGNEVVDIASRQSILIDQDVRNVHAAMNVLADGVTRSFTEPLHLTDEEKTAALARYALAPTGVYHRIKDDGGSAIYYSAVTKIGDFEREKVLKTERFDPLLRSLVRANPLWVQAYLNTSDSMNRIYPFIDVLKAYPPDMKIPDFNFYYEADLQHNPKRDIVWTDVYVDPAGQGWMASCIAPIYNGNVLEGVIGADITVATLIKKVLDMKIPWNGYGMLIGRSGMILALPAGGERDFDLVELTGHDYQNAVLKDTFKPERFNLFKRNDLGLLPTRLEKESHGFLISDLRGQPNHIAWDTIGETGWKLMVVVPRAQIDAQALTLSRRMSKLAIVMVAGLILFYTGFLVFLWRQAQRMSRRIADPLMRMNEQVQAIGRGQYEQSAIPVGVTEVDKTNQGIVEMGRKLGEKEAELLEAEAEKRKMTRNQERLTRELEIAANIQQAMLPQLPQHPEFEFAGTIQPADEVGGDFYDILAKENHLWITIGDVSSHGIGAGLVMMIAQSSIRSIFEINPGLSSEQVWRRTNRLIHSQSGKGLGRDHYITGHLLHHRGQGLFDCVGGHCDPIIINPTTKTARSIETPGPWLGLISELRRVPITQIQLEKGEILCLYSDGITEARNPADEEYGSDRLTKDLVELLCSNQPLQTCIDELLKRVAAFSSKRDDDRTIVIIRYSGG